MAKDCLYCGLQFSDTTHFCPNCGRPTESGFSIRPIQEVKWERLCGEMKEKDDLRKCVRQRDRLHTNQRWYTEQGAFTSRGYASLRTYEWIEVEENDLLK